MSMNIVYNPHPKQLEQNWIGMSFEKKKKMSTIILLSIFTLKEHGIHHGLYCLRSILPKIEKITAYIRKFSSSFTKKMHRFPIALF